VSAIAFPERRLLEADPAVFARDFDKNCFTFTHWLSNSPLLKLLKTDQLLTLARRRARDLNDVYYDAGDIRVYQRWDQSPPCDLPVDKLLRRIETAGHSFLCATSNKILNTPGCSTPAWTRSSCYLGETSVKS
jgi:hypothetical protein